MHFVGISGLGFISGFWAVGVRFARAHTGLGTETTAWRDFREAGKTAVPENTIRVARPARLL